MMSGCTTMRLTENSEYYVDPNTPQVTLYEW